MKRGPEGKHKFGMVIQLDKCTGCGTCVATCPCNAITQFGFSDAQVKSEVLALLGKLPAAAAV